MAETWAFVHDIVILKIYFLDVRLVRYELELLRHHLKVSYYCTTCGEGEGNLFVT